MPERDPCKDPKPGDSVIFGPRQREIYHVIARRPEEVHYQIGPMRAILTCSLTEWQEWCTYAPEIIRPAPENDKPTANQSTPEATQQSTPEVKEGR